MLLFFFLISNLFAFAGLGGLGPEYLLHAAGPASTLASSEIPFSIDGKIYSLIARVISFNFYQSARMCTRELCAPVYSRGIAVTTGR